MKVSRYIHQVSLSVQELLNQYIELINQYRRGAGKDGYRKEGVGKGVMQDQLDLIGLELSNGPMANKYI